MQVSIITINLNDKQGLTKTIESIVNQSFTNYELIVIDGGSEDGSVDVIKKYEEKIAYWISEKDDGIYNAMNKGIAQARGEYCYFINSGDYLADNNVLGKVFETKSYQSFLCANFITDNNGVQNIQKPYKDRDWTFSLYDIYSGDLCHQAFFIKKDMFEKYEQYNEKLKITSDWRLFFIAIGMHNESVSYKDVNLVVYNMEGISSQIGGELIHEERKQTAFEKLSNKTAKKLERLYYLEQNSYITDIIRSNSFLYFIFRGCCKLGRVIKS